MTRPKRARFHGFLLVSFVLIAAVVALSGVFVGRFFELRVAVAKLPGVERVEIHVTFDPPWTPDRIQR